MEKYGYVETEKQKEASDKAAKQGQEALEKKAAAKKKQKKQEEK